MLQTQAMFAAEHNKDEVLEGKFRNLNFFAFHQKRQLSIILNFFFQFIDIRYFSHV